MSCNDDLFKIIGCFVDDLTGHLSSKVAENGQKKRPKIQSDNDQPSNTQRNYINQRKVANPHN